MFLYKKMQDVHFVLFTSEDGTARSVSGYKRDTFSPSRNDLCSLRRKSAHKSMPFYHYLQA